MPKISETLEIKLYCTDFHILRNLAETKNQSLEEYISDVLEKHIDLTCSKGANIKSSLMEVII